MMSHATKHVLSECFERQLLAAAIGHRSKVSFRGETKGLRNSSVKRLTLPNDPAFIRESCIEWFRCRVFQS
jgi:hypothetical protein